MLKKILYLLPLVLLITACKTNPPSSPEIIPTGNVIVNLKVDNSLNATVANKVVLLEDFANVSCNPCVISNQIIEHLSNETYGRNKLVVVKFPTNFPAPNDLFYLAAKEACDARINYYNIFFAPSTIVDGILTPVSTDSVSVKTAVDTRLSVTPRFGININGEFQGDYVLNVNVKFEDTSGVNLSDLVLHIVITETNMEFAQAPGSNGETKFYDVTRLMLPSKDGTPVRDLIDQGELSFNFKDALLSGWNLSNINTVVFIQNKTNKEVYQTGSTFE